MKGVITSEQEMAKGGSYKSIENGLSDACIYASCWLCRYSCDDSGVRYIPCLYRACMAWDWPSQRVNLHADKLCGIARGGR